ncbi:sugar transporter [Alternaria alternata]|nr:sugar transporter [Alternaria alternata]
MSTTSEDVIHAAVTEFGGLPSSMTAAAFLGVALYLCIELNVRLLTRTTSRSLYFWSCLLCSWGLIVHGIAILLLNFHIWEAYSSIVVVELAWLTYVVAQSLVLYSRLNLVLRNTQIGRYVLYMIVVDSVIFGLTTRHPNFTARLHHANVTWDKVQVSAFFVQETLINILYIYETAKYLKNMELLGNCRQTTRTNLRNLIAVNVLIIILDCSVMGLCFSGYFDLQGCYKVAVYAVKLRTEFMILNQLRKALTGASTGGSGLVVQRDAGISLPKRNNVVEVVE